MNIQQLHQKFTDLEFKPEGPGNESNADANESKINDFISGNMNLHHPNIRETLIAFEKKWSTDYPFVSRKINELLFKHYFNDDVTATIFDWFIDKEKKSPFSSILLFSLPLVSKIFLKHSLLMIPKLDANAIPLSGEGLASFFYERAKERGLTESERFPFFYKMANSSIIHRLRYHNIKKVNLTHFHQFETKCFSNLIKKCNDLESIKLGKGFGKIQITEEVIFEMFDNNPNLDSFQLECLGSDFINWKSFNFRKDRYYKLRVLDVESITESSLINIMDRCTNLESIKTGKSSKISGVRFADLRCKHSSLRSLILKNSLVFNIGLGDILDKCPNLESLNLPDNSVTDLGLQMILNRCVNLTSLDLSGCQITAEGIAAVSSHFKAKEIACTYLRSLDLSYTQFSFKDIYSFLSKFDRLQSLILDKSQTMREISADDTDGIAYEIPGRNRKVEYSKIKDQWILND